MSDDLRRRAEELGEPVSQDDALAMGLAALQVVPVVGGVVATFISEYVPRQKQQRLVRFVQDLGREFEAAQDRLDRDFVRTADFDRRVEDVLDRVQSVRNEAKLGDWAALLAGLATTDRPSATDQERLIETLDALRSEHLRVLWVIATTHEARPGLFMGGVADTLSWTLPDMPADEVRRRWDDLARAGVVGPYPSGTMTREGAGNLTLRLTPYGRTFVRLLKLEAGRGDPPGDGDGPGEG